MLSFAIDFRKHSQAIGNVGNIDIERLSILVRHSKAFATFVRHLQGVCNAHRFQFLANVLPLLVMIRMPFNVANVLLTVSRICFEHLPMAIKAS